MAPFNRLASTRVTTRTKPTSENTFPGKNVPYSKRKAEYSPLKTKNTKRPALNDLTNDGKTAKVKSIRNDKSLAVYKDKCVDKADDLIKVKSHRTLTGIRLPPIRKTVSTKTVNETITKAAETSKKPTNQVTVQTKLTVQSGAVLRRSSRVRNEINAPIVALAVKEKQTNLHITRNSLRNEKDSKLEHSVKEKESKLNITRNSLRSKESILKENLEPTIVLQKVDVVSKSKISACAVQKNTDKSSTDEEETRLPRRSSRLSFRKSLTADKSSGSNSLYVSALEDITDTTKKDTKGDWCELTEFDKELIHDPHQVSLYAAEIFHYLKTREDHFRISDYMTKLTGISEEMRTILVDWMVEVQENFELNHETLYLSVKIVDAYLDKIEDINKNKLQLVGVSAMFVACKYDERLSPLLEDFVYVCDGAYEPKDILAMEQNLLSTLKYELSFPISYSFLRRYARCARVPMPLLTLARFILELSLIDYSTVTLSDSKQAAAALYLAFRMVKHSNWTESLVSYTGYKLEDFKDIVFLFNSILRKKFPEEVRAVRTKYSHIIFFEVSKTRLVSDEELKKNIAEYS